MCVNRIGDLHTDKNMIDKIPLRDAEPLDFKTYPEINCESVRYSYT